MKYKTTLAALEKEFDSKPIPYARLLQTIEWSDKRQVIIERDGCKCSRCQTTETDVIGAARNKERRYNYYFISEVKKEDGKPVTALVLSPKGEVWFEVHHKFYILGKNPWEYPDDALVTLCNHCHQEIHDVTRIPMYNNTGEALGYMPCHRCHGSGSFPEYSHVQSGVCFRCNGARYEELISR